MKRTRCEPPTGTHYTSKVVSSSQCHSSPFLLWSDHAILANSWKSAVSRSHFAFLYDFRKIILCSENAQETKRTFCEMSTQSYHKLFQLCEFHLLTFFSADDFRWIILCRRGKWKTRVKGLSWIMLCRIVEGGSWPQYVKLLMVLEMTATYTPVGILT